MVLVKFLVSGFWFLAFGSGFWFLVPVLGFWFWVLDRDLECDEDKDLDWYLDRDLD